MTAATTGEDTHPAPAGHPFGQLEYPTSPEHVHDDHIESAWTKANDRVAARFGEKGR